MITLKYIPNILKNEGRIIVEVPFSSDQGICDYLVLENEFIVAFDLEKYKVIVSGVVVKDLTTTLNNGDEVIVTPNIKYEALIGIGFSSFWASVTVIGLTVLTLAYSIYSALQKPKTPNYGVDGQGLDDSSANRGWDGISNTQEVGIPIPVPYGEVRVGGEIINQFIRTDGDKQYLNLLFALGEGEIDSIESIEINENPSANFDNITLNKRYGTNSQTQIPNFNDSHDLKALNVNLVKNDAYIYTTDNSDVTCFELNLTFAGGLYQEGAQGSVASWAVTYEVSYKLHADVNYIGLVSTTIDGLSRTDLRRVYRKAGLTAGKYDIKIERVSDDSSLDPLKQGDLYLKGVDEIAQDEPLIYPNLALLGVEALATDQLSGSTPTITSLIRGRKVSVPDVRVSEGGSAVIWDDYYWDPTASKFKLLDGDTQLYWDGSTYINAFSANPVWCLRDLLTNTRYGLGDYITTTELDETQLLEMAKYCEEKVSDGNAGYEKRFRLDVIIDSETKAIDLITQLTSSFRAFAFYSNGAIKLKIDKAESPVQMFGMGNIISESFTQSWKSLKEVPNVIEVQFQNKDLNYKQDIISVIDEASISAGDPIRKKSLRLFCTHVSQAIREGRYALNVAKYIERTVTLRASIEAIACQTGDVINVAHDLWGMSSGRVLTGSTTTKVKLDQPITLLGGKTYKIRVRFADDTQEEKTISDSAGTYIEVNVVGDAFSQAPANYDTYSLGEVNKVVAPYRIISIKRAGSSEVEITALEYDVDVYDTDTIALPDNNYSSLSTTIPDVTNLNLVEGVSMSPDGSVKANIEVWFDKPNDSSYQNKYASAKIYLSDNAGASYNYVGMTYGRSYVIEGALVKGNTYYVKAVTVCSNALEDSLTGAPASSIVIAGKLLTPANVAGFDYSWGDLLLLTWNLNTEIDLVGYEIRDENANWGVDDAHLIYRGLANRKTLQPTNRTVGSFYIKALNRSGVYSATAGSITPTNSAPAIPTGLGADVMFNTARAYWADVAGADLLYYEVYGSPTDAWVGEESLIGKVSGKSILLNSKAPREGTVESATGTTLVDDSLIGLGDDFLNGDTIEIVSGTGSGQVKTITDFVDASGTITVNSDWDTTPDNTSKYRILDNIYIKVRGVDSYGAGNFTSSIAINYTNITESMLGDNIVTARKIYVACLSALSANLGVITAGTITGAVFQTATGGARTIFDQNGICSYDANCCLNLQICNGCVVARTLKLLSYTCDCDYTFLDSGQLKFHDVLGDVPYIKRLSNGSIATGGTVCLLGWITEPKVMLSVKELMSYNSTQSASCQKWIIYNDSPVYYCNCATDYGYCFVAHACLVTSASTGGECIKNIAMDTCTLTGASVCSTQVRLQFQLWCNNNAPSNYYYGTICFAICYRVNGSGTWCACCFCYDQPHASTGELTTTTNKCVTLAFPCGECWQLMAHQVSITYTDSGICATGTCNASVCCASAGNFLNALTLCSNTYDLCCAGTSASTTCSLDTGFDPTGKTIICYCHGFCYTLNYCHYVRCGASKYLCYAYSNRYTSCHSVVVSPTSLNNTLCHVPASYAFICCCCTANSNYASGWLTSGYCRCTRVTTALRIANCDTSYPYCQCGWTNVCITGVWHCICYSVSCGSCALCNYQCLYSITDTYSAQCVLDPAGCLNWLALAYN